MPARRSRLRSTGCSTPISTLRVDRRRLLSRYRIVDAARKVVGVGSVGTACWVVLLQGVDEDDPLFLQVKEAQPSVLAPHVDHKLPFDNQGRRVVVGQRMTQGSPDIFLGWCEIDGKHFYVRQLADMKGGGIRRRARPACRLRGVLRPVRLGAGSGPRQVRRRGEDRRLLRQQQRPRRRPCKVRAGLCRANRQGP